MILEQETAISKAKHQMNLAMHFNPDLVSDFLSLKRQTISNIDSAVSWQVGFALPPCVYFPCNIQLRETHIILPSKSWNTHTSSTAKSSLILARVEGGVSRRRQTGWKKEAIATMWLTRSPTCLNLTWQLMATKSAKKRSVQELLKGMCLPGSPTIHLIWKPPQKTYKAVWLNFTMPSWGLGFFVVFVSIQWSSIASLEMTVGGNAIFHYTKYK